MAANLAIELTPDYAAGTVTGEIDGKTAPEIQARLVGLAETHARLRLDMEGVTFLSSSGLRMLLLLYRHFAAKSGEVILVAVPEEIRDTMSMTGFSSFFTFLDHASDHGPGRS